MPDPAQPPLRVLFSVPPDQLPSPLPTVAEAEASTDVLSEYSTRRTVRAGNYIVKYGVDVRPIEAQTMMFVRNHTDVPVLQVYAVWQKPLLASLASPILPPPPQQSSSSSSSSPDNSSSRTATTTTTVVTIIVMENMFGLTLLNAWSDLSAKQKASVADRLRGYWDALRRDIPPAQAFENVRGGALADSLFWSADSDEAITGPFDSARELVDGLLARLSLDGGGERIAQKVAYYRRVLPKVLLNSSGSSDKGGGGDCDIPVFTHGDFQRRNIVVRVDGSLMIVDWASAGFYPAYWEYATAMFAAGGWGDDWHAYVARILDEFPNEYLWLQDVRLEMWS